MHNICLLLGSNIHPEANIRAAVRLLGNSCTIEKISSVWETSAMGSPGPNFLNLAILLKTDASAAEFKENTIRIIEKDLGRVHLKDKNAPRTIDIDIIVFDNEVIDPSVWSTTHVALPVAELLPDLVNPHNQLKLNSIAERLSQENPAKSQQKFEFTN